LSTTVTSGDDDRDQPHLISERNYREVYKATIVRHLTNVSSVITPHPLVASYTRTYRPTTITLTYHIVKYKVRPKN